MPTGKTAAFFDGTDSTSDNTIWLTDGTAAGTIEIGGLTNAGIAGANTSSFLPSFMAVFNHLAYFAASDNANKYGLWISDGTATGTAELGGPGNQAIPGAGTNGLSPPSFFQYQGKVLFNAEDTSGNLGLWVTDGTAAGTFEIGGLADQGVSNASTIGLGPDNFTLFNGRVYFGGRDNGGINSHGFWVTDGTTAGTTEIGGPGSKGIVGAGPFGLIPESMLDFDGRLLLAGVDSGNGTGLWTSDGTAAGTTELGGLKNQSIAGANANGLSPSSLTRLNDKVLFVGQDSSNFSALWVTDGTAAGTSEIGGLANQGVFDAASFGLQPFQMVRLGNKVLFNGRNAAGENALWVTDGSAAGTAEVGGFHNQDIAGVSTSGLNPTDFALLDGKVVFAGTDTLGGRELWITDGTAGGTVKLSVGNLQPFGIAAQAIPVIDDLSGDGRSDILWRNTGGGLADWTMLGSAITSSGFASLGGTPVLPDASWSVIGIDDFTGDSIADALWRNTSGALALWTMQSPTLTSNGPTIASSGPVTFNGATVAPDATWSVAATGDFNNDGFADIVWRRSDGTLTDWSMNGSTIISTSSFTASGSPVNPDSSWTLAGTGDFDGDTAADLLWRNASGEVTVWLMNGTSIASSADATSNGASVRPGASWTIAAIGDFDGDLKSDVLWRNSNGSIAEWQMNRSVITSSAPITFNGSVVQPDSSWQVIEVGDFNGDGHSDLLWRSTSGALAEWLMNGNEITQSLAPTFNGGDISPDAGWTPQAKPTNNG